jgi:hypothetical protein
MKEKKKQKKGKEKTRAPYLAEEKNRTRILRPSATRSHIVAEATYKIQLSSEPPLQAIVRPRNAWKAQICTN